MTRVLLALALVPLLLITALAAVAGGPGDPPYASGPSELARGEIPPSLLGVYRDAAGGCSGLPWQVLAAVGWIESRHGGSRLDPSTGDVRPPILGPALDGSPGRARIPDAREADGWAHTHGPMQFLLGTWAGYATLAPGRPAGALPSPDNAWDAIHTAARYLCGGADRIDDVAQALWRYNHSEAYVEDVLAKAAEYGLFAGAPAAGGGTAAVADATVPGSTGAVVAAAMSALGVPYVWGGSRPETGFDCSGLVQWAYAQAGIAMPRTTAGQIRIGVAVTGGELAPGDLIFSRGGRAGAVHDFGHVAIYIGGGQVVVAPRTGRDVAVADLDPSRVQAVRRVLSGPVSG